MALVLVGIRQMASVTGHRGCIHGIGRRPWHPSPAPPPQLTSCWHHSARPMLQRPKWHVPRRIASGAVDCRLASGQLHGVCSIAVAEPPAPPPSVALPVQLNASDLIIVTPISPVGTSWGTAGMDQDQGSVKCAKPSGSWQGTASSIVAIQSLCHGTSRARAHHPVPVKFDKILSQNPSEVPHHFPTPSSYIPFSTKTIIHHHRHILPATTSFPVPPLPAVVAASQGPVCSGTQAITTTDTRSFIRQILLITNPDP